MVDDKFSGKRERPHDMPGVTQRVDTGWGEVFVNINSDGDGDPFEVFITIGESGGIYHAHAEGLAKTISNAIRSGTDPRVIAEDLAGIRSGRQAEDNGDMIYSIEDAVGVAMLRFIDDKLDPVEPVRGDAEPGSDGPGDTGPEAGEL